MIKKLFSFITITSAITLTAGFTAPLTAFAKDSANADGAYYSGNTVSGSEQNSHRAAWADDIPAMLSAGSYAPGEVVAGVISYGAPVKDNEIINEGDTVMDITESGKALFDEPIPHDGEVHVVYVQRDDMSTEEILYALAEDDRVLFAEPNYIFESGDSSHTLGMTDSSGDSSHALGMTDASGDSSHALGTTDTSDDSPLPLGMTEIVQSDNISDLTPFQWSSSDNSSWLIEGSSPSSIHVPGFGATGSNMSGEPVIVAVFDSAFDVTHPDLAPVAYTFSPELQGELGCDVNGFNATSQSTDGKLMHWDRSYHGTHCAGIIGAAWDGQGISGVASNVRLVSVQNCTDNGYTSLINSLRGYDFVDRANELGCNISITSNSWGLMQNSRAIDSAVRKLGDKWGVVSVFAAGNDSKDLELIGDSSDALFDNPYVIMVASEDSAGNKSPFSNYGKNTVDFAAPGSGILSTVNVNEKAARYLADATPSTNKFYEGFEGDPAVTVSQTDFNPDTPDTTGTVTELSHFAGARSLKLSLDPQRAESDLSGNKVYRVLLDLGDLSACGVGAGDFIGFTAGSNKRFMVGGLSYIDPATGNEESLYETSRGGVYNSGWTENYFVVPEEMDRANTQIVVNVIAGESLEAIYIDSIGAGTRKVPYGSLDGTSMACPAISGATAVLKASSGLSGSQLANLVRSKVRHSDSFSQITKTGGIFDFEANGAEEVTFTPTIQEVVLDRKTLTLQGTGFTDNGTLSLSRYIAGQAPAEISASVISWSDNEVVAELTDAFRGIMQLTLTNKGGKYYNTTKYVSKGENNYEEELPFDKYTGEPYAFDAPGDLETNGPLIGLDNKLYYFPAATPVEDSESFKKMLCFDINSKTWQELPEIPEPLTFFSAVMYEGQIIVKGSSMEILPDGSPSTSYDPQVKIYIYNPLSNVWEQASASGVHEMDTLANNDGQLILAGGGGFSEDPVTREEIDVPATVRKYHIETGAGDEIARLSKDLYRPNVACRNRVIYVFDRLGYTLERVEGGKSVLLENCLPEYVISGTDDDKTSHDTEKYGILLPVAEGIVFVGPLAADGSGDTYILRDGAESFVTYEKRMSDDKVSFHTAASYRGYIYAIGASLLEPENRFFRRTAIEVPEYKGDIIDSPDEEDDKKEDENTDSEEAEDKKEDSKDTSKTDDRKNEASRPSVKPVYNKKSPADTQVTVAPKTGDNNYMLLWQITAVTACAGIGAGIIIIRHKCKE